MEEILLIVMMLAVFVFCYFVTDRFGRFMRKRYGGYREAKEPDRKRSPAVKKGKRTKNNSKASGSRNGASSVIK